LGYLNTNLSRIGGIQKLTGIHIFIKITPKKGFLVNYTVKPPLFLYLFNTFTIHSLNRILLMKQVYFFTPLDSALLATIPVLNSPIRLPLAARCRRGF
jgi:hypothetical protein